MPSKPIRIMVETIEKLDKYRTPMSNIPHVRLYPSYTEVIEKLHRDSQELARIEQSAMSVEDSMLESLNPSKSPINSNKHALKKSSMK